MLVRSEDLDVGLEAGRGAAPVLNRAIVLQLGYRFAALVALCPEYAIARDLDFQEFGEGVDDGRTDTVQAAARLVGAGLELDAAFPGADEGVGVRRL